MHGIIKLIIGAVLGKALSESPAQTEEHTTQNTDLLKKIAGINPSRTRGVVFFAAEETDQGIYMHANVVGDGGVIEALMMAAESTVAAAYAERVKEEKEADDCDCSNCRLRRALVGRGLAEDLGDGVGVVLAPDADIEQLIKDVTRKTH